jgi:glycosyltransferase involved in cell wall biosynthesis
LTKTTHKSSVILYDFLLVPGGAESLTLTLSEALPELDLGVAFINYDSFANLPIGSERITTLCGKTTLTGWQTIKLSHTFMHKSQWISDYEKVIFSGSNAPLAVSQRLAGGNILYCHTPPRFVYDLKEYYMSTNAHWKRPLYKLLIRYFRPKYERAIERMDLIIANSKNVQQRIKQHLGRDSIVIYPPCHIDKYRWLSQGDYYLSTARVEPYKRIKLIVEAFKHMPDKKLVVASGGSILETLQRQAQGFNNIHFTGWCKPQALHNLMGNCIATLYLPMDEDFGISPVESMAAGKPVIGVDEGGVKETVLAGETGLLCPANPQVADIVAAVTHMTPEYALSLKHQCEQRAHLFSAEIFIDKMQTLLNCDLEQLQVVAESLDAK